MQTTQLKLQAKLSSLSIPSREIRVYGSQIMVTCLSEKAARRWADLIRKFATVRAVGRGIDYTADADRYPNERGKHTINVWRVWAHV